MTSPNTYDVTAFVSPTGTSPYSDIGQVINEIISDIKANQTSSTTRPGAVIYIPPGHYTLLTTVMIDISYLQIKGAGHGFLSQETRDYDSSWNPATWREYNPGASHVVVGFNNTGPQAAFKVERAGNYKQVGRVSGLEFRDFIIDGAPLEAHTRPYDTRPHKIGIAIDSPTDSTIISGMCFTHTHSGVVTHHADGLMITNNFICEIGNCIELYDNPICPKISNNMLWADWRGYGVLIEGGDSAMISDNHFGYWGNLKITSHERGSIIGNKFTSWWPRSINVDVSNQMYIASNHLYRLKNDRPSDQVSFYDDDDGILYCNGARNTIIGNLIAVEIDALIPGSSQLNAIYVDGGNACLMMNRILQLGSTLPRLFVPVGSQDARILYSCTAAQNAVASPTAYVLNTP
ncbi:MAG: right-handed parallel beta-helix repeat-containing protein [Bifidobacteriaceae bacterium]|jgi:inulin fructotransferase (DFA-I-forming)|nr:right-handed parallel beta-helix repeat-containing protein [Bifidobacteriaceae bacterium]